MAKPNKILVVGDTGCEIKPEHGDTTVQDCNDPTQWAWAAVAAAAASEQADLVVHVGDYHYREVDCPKHEHGCAGSDVGDTWESWDQDFFTPAVPLLASAPWIFVRGNHELCARAGNGWFYFLDPRPFPANGCSDKVDPYLVQVGDHTIAVVDAADDKNIQASLDQLPVLTDSILWIVQHRPFLTAGADDEPTANNVPILPLALQAAGKVGAVITGHAHRVAIDVFADDTPPEIISGNGGTSLEHSHLPGHIVLGGQALNGYTTTQYYDYGYMTFERQEAVGIWKLVVHDRKSKPVCTCTIQEGLGQKTQVSCDQKILAASSELH